METGDPLVSIIIPVYNGENYLREAIDSALAQTYENIEIIVVNDGSTDSTEEIALSYGDRIRYFKKPNGGVSSALNLAIDNMRGEYFSWLSHDDRYLPDKVLKSVSAISSPDEVVLCNHRVIDENGHPMRKGERNHRFADRELVSGEKAVSNLMRYGAYNGCSLLIPRESFEKCGGFDETMRFAQDMMMWIRIFLSGYSLRYLDDQLVQYRQHSAQVTLMRQDLFHHDSEWMSEFVIPLLEKSDNGLLFEYALFNARYDNPSVVESCCEVGIFSLMERFAIRVVSLYGIVRPLLKRIWLKIA